MAIAGSIGRSVVLPLSRALFAIPIAPCVLIGLRDWVRDGRADYASRASGDPVGPAANDAFRE